MRFLRCSEYPNKAHINGSREANVFFILGPVFGGMNDLIMKAFAEFPEIFFANYDDPQRAALKYLVDLLERTDSELEKIKSEKARLLTVLKYIRGGILLELEEIDEAFLRSILATIDDLAGDLIHPKTTV
jgi:hypothetical protein